MHEGSANGDEKVELGDYASQLAGFALVDGRADGLEVVICQLVAIEDRQ